MVFYTNMASLLIPGVLVIGPYWLLLVPPICFALLVESVCLSLLGFELVVNGLFLLC